MNRITAALYRFLVVYLSVATVVTSIPLAPSTAYADDAGAVAVESEAQETDSSSDADVDAVDNASSSGEGSSSTTSDQTNNAQDESPGSDTSTSTSSLAQDLSSSATDSDAAKSLVATAEPRPMTAKSIPSCMRIQRSMSMPSLCRTAMCIRAMQAEALR